MTGSDIGVVNHQHPPSPPLTSPDAIGSNLMRVHLKVKGEVMLREKGKVGQPPRAGHVVVAI